MTNEELTKLFDDHDILLALRLNPEKRVADVFAVSVEHWNDMKIDLAMQMVGMVFHELRLALHPVELARDMPSDARPN